MRPKHPALLSLLLFAHLTISLHFGQSSVQHFDAAQELATLRDQQTSFEKQITGLIGDIKDIEAKVKATNNTNEKVILVENAILSERQKIFQIQNSIIPPFNLSKNACYELTNDQKIKILGQIQKAKTQLSQLKTIASRIPINPELTQINNDIAKQEILIQSLQKMIYTKCQSSIVLTPTIFQSNLYATNWILGKQTITDLIDLYYQRSRQYHNITNCPINIPFWDGQYCTQCSGDTPIFNMETSRCDKCPHDTSINPDKRICQQMPHYTDYKSIQNYVLDGAAALPPVPPNLTPCPSTKPFYTTVCIKCSLPSYWSVKENKCKDCPAGNVFNVNTKLCTVPKGDTITYLEGNSRWVTAQGNFTKVLEERAQLLKNKTNVASCGKDTPYFDGITCINCPNEFSLADKKCVSAPQGLVYNPNLHSYVKADIGNQTNPQAPNIISPTPLPPTATNPCNINTPFYDGISCLQCPQPYPLFNVSSKKCVQCGPHDIYDNKTLQCKKREIVYISTNFTDVVATPKVSLAGYKTELLNKVKNNGDTIVRKCKPDQYSNYTYCFKCPIGQKFNLQAKQCFTCKGTVDPNTFLCQPPKTLLTNLGANNLIFGPNATVASYTQQQQKVTGPIAVCPFDRPYAINNGTQCTNCKEKVGEVYFDMETQKCAGCPLNLFYNSIDRKCDSGIFITNIPAVKNYIQNDNYTFVNVKAQLDLLSTKRKTTLCPNNTPVASADGSKCADCANDSYVDLQKLACVTGQTNSNIDALTKSGKVIQLGNFTLANLQAKQTLSAQTIPSMNCPAQTPLYNGLTCIACPLDKYYNLQQLKCYTPKVVSNVNALVASARYAQVDASTIDSLRNLIKLEQLPVVECKADTPLYNGTQCLYCPTTSYYNLKDLNCYTPTFVTNTNSIGTKNFIELGEATLANLAQLIRASRMPTAPCPDATPMFTGTQCISCAPTQFYNLKGLNCLKQQDVSNVPALNKTLHVVEQGQYTLASISAAIANSKLPTKICPDATPLFNGKACISCPVDQYYNLASLTCYKPVFSSNVDALNKTNRVLQLETYTLQALQNQIAAQKFPTQPCPAQTPLLSGSNCIACPADQYYNLKTSLCYQPLKDTNINYLTTSKFYIQVGNSTLANLKATLAKNLYPTVPCPQASPIWNGTFCLGCPQGNYYILSNFNCYEPKKVSNVTSLNTTKNYLEAGGVTLLSLQQQIKNQPFPVYICPQKTPLSDGKTCIGCTQDQIYNLQTKICINPNTVSNTDAILISNNYIQTNSINLTTINLAASKLPDPKRTCPAQTPLYNGTTCLSCAQSLYNLQSMKCANCISDYTYDTTTHRCIQKPNYYPNLNNNQWMVSSDNGLNNLKLMMAQQKALKDPKKCPKEKPHFNNKNKDCQACAQNTIFNYDTSTCVTCPIGQEVRLNTRRCATRLVGQFQTSLDAKNLLYEGNPKAQFVDAYNANKQAYPNIKDCPSNQPYFDGFGCITCPDTSALFSLVSQLCTTCPANYSYMQAEKQCRGKAGQLKSSGPTISKMYSSIF